MIVKFKQKPGNVFYRIGFGTFKGEFFLRIDIGDTAIRWTRK